VDEQLLKQIGLSASEARLYQAVLDAGNATPTLLGKLSGIKRTTAYSIARSLVEKGLLTEDTTRRPRVFRVVPPDEVLGLIEYEKKQSEARAKTYRIFANELSKLSAGKSYPIPTVRLVEEEKIESFLKQQSPVWNANLAETNTTWWGFQDHTFVEHYEGWIRWYWKQAFKVIDLKLLSNRSPVETKFSASATSEQNKRRIIKFWGEATHFLSTTWIVGDYIIMVNTRDRPFYLVEIHDKRMAHDQREVFANLWQLID
jgi:sugar-specific transcriptional regulator TrmB